MRKPPCFLKWIRRQTHRDDPVGGVSKDAVADPHFPAVGGWREAQTYVGYRGGAAAEQALAKAVAEWKAMK